MKTTTLEAKDVKLMIDNLEIEEMAASASISLNPNVTWLKIVLTDDGFNANRQRIPREEFANVIRTGTFMPLKMSESEISEGHEPTFPIGVLTHLRTVGNTIEALAALWNRERTEDIRLLREKYAGGESVDVSWEVTYTKEDEEENGVSLRDISMNAAAIVSLPAYQGRTPVIALASEDIQGDSLMNTIEIAEHEKIVTELTTKLQETEAMYTELKVKYDELDSFKKQYDASIAKAQRLDEVKKKFESSGIKVSEDYFSTRAETLCGMEDDQLEFFIQELVAAFDTSKETKPENGEASVSITSTKVPVVGGSSQPTVTYNDIITYLKSKK